MAFVLNDRVKETSTTTGTGTFSLAGAEVGFESFVSGIGTTNSTFYAISNDGKNEYEVGIGTVTDASPDTLSRTTIISSTNSDNAVNFTSGTKTGILYISRKTCAVCKYDSHNLCNNTLVNNL